VQVASYKAHGFIIKTLSTDGEGSIASLKPEIEGWGIAVNTAGPGQHEAVAERSVREVKEHTRAVHHSLPYRLAASLVVWLVYFAVSRINMIPHRSGAIGASPRESFLGIKVNYKKDLRCGFGEYLECNDPYPDNTLKARTQACISLLPVGTQGAVKCLSLNTSRVVTRDQFRILVLPMPDTIISHMNRLADAKDGSPSDASFEFSMANGGVANADTPEEPYNYDPNEQMLNVDEYRVVNADEAIEENDEIIFESRADVNFEPLLVPLEDINGDEWSEAKDAPVDPENAPNPRQLFPIDSPEREKSPNRSPMFDSTRIENIDFSP
jgi:hypothetical protein